MIKVGDNHWYGKTVPQNITFAAEMYAEAASKNDLPQVNFIHPRTEDLKVFIVHSRSLSFVLGLRPKTLSFHFFNRSSSAHCNL